MKASHERFCFTVCAGFVMVTFPLYVYVYEQCTTESIARMSKLALNVTVYKFLLHIFYVIHVI